MNTGKIDADTQPIYDEALDKIVQTVDYNCWKLTYNHETAEEPDFVGNDRDVILRILETLYNDIKKIDKT